MQFLNLLANMKESVLLEVQKATDFLQSKASAQPLSKVFVLWDEDLLTLVNIPKNFLKELTFTSKSLETDNRGRRKSVRKTEHAYEETTVAGKRVVKTLPGFWRKAVTWLIQNNVPFSFEDLRTPDLLPLPKLGLMHGFRFSQKELITEALSASASGLIGGPTRYGKTVLMINTLRAFPGNGKNRFQTIVTLPGADLLKQTYDDLCRQLPDRDIKMIGGGSRVKFQSEDITVCSADSLHLIDPGPVRLLLIDEPHAMVAKSRIEHIPKFALARKYGFGATLTGRYDGFDFLLEGLIGPVLAKRTYKQAVEEGAICPIRVMMVKWPLPNLSGDRDSVYKQVLFESELMGRCARYLSDQVIPSDWQMLYFIKTENQADFLSECIGRDVSVAMAKKLSSKERQVMTENVRKNKIKRVICSDIYVQGVTFHDVMVLVNCGGGGNSTSTIQKPGRLAEIRPGKNAGLMIDFLFEPASKGGPAGSENTFVSDGLRQVCNESSTRMAAYKDIGYDVHVVDRKDILSWFESQKITAPNASKD